MEFQENHDSTGRGTPRNLVDVIDQILAVTPKTSAYRYLVSRLEDIKISARFAAPERMTDWWRATAYALEEELGAPDDALKLEIQAIFAWKG